MNSASHGTLIHQMQSSDSTVENIVSLVIKVIPCSRPAPPLSPSQLLLTTPMGSDEVIFE